MNNKLSSAATVIILIIFILFSFTPTASAAHTFDTSGTYQTTAWSTTNPGTLAYTAGTGASLMVLHIQNTVALRTAGTPTFNGKSFTNLGRAYSGTEGSSELWYLLLVPADTGSAYTVSVPNAVTSRAMTFQVSTYKSATGSSLFDKNISGIGTTAAPSQSLTSATNGAVYVSSIFNGRLACVLPTTPGVQLYCNDGGAFVGASQYYLQATAGAQAIGWGFVADDWSMQTAVFIEKPPPPAITITSFSNNVTYNESLSWGVQQGATTMINLTTDYAATSNSTTVSAGVSATAYTLVGTNFAANFTFSEVGTKLVNLTLLNSTSGTAAYKNFTITVTNLTLESAFSVTLPIGYTTMDFNPPNSTAKYFYPDGQNLSVPFYVITNDGTVANTFRFYLDGIVTGITLYADLDTTHTTGAKEINTTANNPIVSSLASTASQNIWMYINLSNPVQQTTAKTLTINDSVI